MRVNPSSPANQRIQQSTNDLPKKPSIELLTTDNSKLNRNECRPGECAPMFGGKCWPDQD